MQWFDWMTLGIVLATAVIQAVRAGKAGGMGLPLFEGAGVIVAATGATGLSGPLAQALNMQKATVMIILFIVFTVLAFVVGRGLFSLTNWSFQSMDGFFGFVWGFAMGWAIAHMVLRIIIESQGTNGPVAAGMENAVIAREVFQFRTWNSLMQLLFKAKLGPDFNPDVG
ncbi:MAG: hypothetical protein ABIK37_04750 [candidate division WOR-3 bacterium]